jgi:HTH-type transcriptional regulator / antitoxin HigA
MSSQARKKSTVAPGYFELVRRFPLVPIRNETHLKAAFSVLDELAIIDEEKLTREQADYLAVLTDLVEKYEDVHHSPESSFRDGIDALKYLLAQSKLTASDLGRLLGNRQLGAAILRGERQLSKVHVIKLAKRFSVSTDLFLKERTAKGRAA